MYFSPNKFLPITEKHFDSRFFNRKTKQKVRFYLCGICCAANILSFFFWTLGLSACMSSETRWLLAGPGLAAVEGAGTLITFGLAGSGFIGALAEKETPQSLSISEKCILLNAYY